MTTQIKHPDYYCLNGFECSDYIEAFNLNFNLGSAVKYITRAGRKTPDPVPDLEKAAECINREITHQKKLQANQPAPEDYLVPLGAEKYLNKQ